MKKKIVTDMAKTDFTYCRGIHCPNRNQCKRYVIGLEAVNDGNSNHSWIQSCRHAKLFIHKDGSEEVQRLSTGFRLDEMNEDDLLSLREMIKGAGLVERRHWNRTLTELNEILK